MVFIIHVQEELLRSGHPFGASIRAKGTDLQQLWSLVNDAANERHLALQGAIQVFLIIYDGKKFNLHI